ncbi:hypothetical protein GRAN_2467 [Granulicella sibirica]|uniref:Uncharacterized protein n=1 Tax=Granulicella sibirica TaxID=2479048 RepID=A0A4Q0SZY4_9BACT|nr:hypothetical protein GRAN_2467 [Granulicella sibirica]
MRHLHLCRSRHLGHLQSLAAHLPPGHELNRNGARLHQNPIHKVAPNRPRPYNRTNPNGLNPVKTARPAEIEVQKTTYDPRQHPRSPHL